MPCLQRQTLGLVELALFDQELRQRPLGFAERRAVLERCEHADRLAQELLRPRGLALLPRGPSREIERAPQSPGGADLLEVRTRLLELVLSLVVVAAREVQLPEKAMRPTEGGCAADLLRKRERAVGQRLGAVELHLTDVDAREGVQHLALQILA